MRRILSLSLLLAACGGTITPADGGDGGTNDAPNTIDASGYTNCAAPSGDRICGGSNNCGQGGCTDPPPFNTSHCLPIAAPYQNAASVCLNQGVEETPDCTLCADGKVCVLNPQ